MISAQEAGDVAYSMLRDRDNLFSLADKVLAAAPASQWGVWVADACSSHFLVQFLSDVYSLSGAVDGGPPPTVHITNSRWVRDLPEHQWAVRERLAQDDLAIAGKNALIISEYTKDRYALSTLCSPLRSVGAAAIDAAVLNLDYMSMGANPVALPDTIYKGEPRYYEPAIYSSILRVAVGQTVELGIAEPLNHPKADLELKDYVTNAFRNLAHEYIDQAAIQ
ncbi:MAG TPA: hypothetical protein VLG11_01570 [Candidatus Saccharimonadales bacterium]|nr:hypothetical protein [Candidatus Saccharimonadales bacterium]